MSEPAAPAASSPPPKTFISDLRPSRVATVDGTIARLEATREVPSRDGGTTKVRNATLKDGTGEIQFVLWGNETELVAEGESVTIVDGWVKEYKGKPQISLGRTGKLTKR